MNIIKKRNSHVLMIIGAAITAGLLVGWVVSKHHDNAVRVSLPAPVARRPAAELATGGTAAQSRERPSSESASTTKPPPDWANPKVANARPGQYGKGAHWKDVEAQVMTFFGNNHGRYLSDKYVYHSGNASLVDQYTASTYEQYATEYQQTDFAYDKRLHDGTRMLVKQYDTNSMMRVFLFLSADQSEVLAAGMTTFGGTGYQIQVFANQGVGLTPDIQQALQQYVSGYYGSSQSTNGQPSLPIALHVLH